MMGNRMGAYTRVDSSLYVRASSKLARADGDFLSRLILPKQLTVYEDIRWTLLGVLQEGLFFAGWYE